MIGAEVQCEARKGQDYSIIVLKMLWALFNVICAMVSLGIHLRLHDFLIMLSRIL